MWCDRKRAISFVVYHIQLICQAFYVCRCSRGLEQWFCFPIPLLFSQFSHSATLKKKKKKKKSKKFPSRELHGLIKWNPWQKASHFSLYLIISAKGESAIHFGGKKKKRRFGTLLMAALCKHCWEIWLRTICPGDDYFSCSEARALLLLCPGFWNCPKFIWAKTGTK